MGSDARDGGSEFSTQNPQQRNIIYAALYLPCAEPF
jgi:hypothetical protein